MTDETKLSSAPRRNVLKSQDAYRLREWIKANPNTHSWTFRKIATLAQTNLHFDVTLWNVQAALRDLGLQRKPPQLDGPLAVEQQTAILARELMRVFSKIGLSPNPVTSLIAAKRYVKQTVVQEQLPQMGGSDGE